MSEPEGTSSGNSQCGAHDVIHLGDQAAVVVTVADYRRLRALEQAATAEALEDAEDTAALQEWRELQAAGQATTVPLDEVRRRLGLWSGGGALQGGGAGRADSRRDQAEGSGAAGAQ